MNTATTLDTLPPPDSSKGCTFLPSPSPAPSKYAEFRVTADAIVICHNKYGVPHVLLIQRGKEPFIGSWCFPGGHVDRDEDLIDAAVRELREETGLKVEPYEFTQLVSFGKPGRDPRGQYVTVPFVTVLQDRGMEWDGGPLKTLPKIKGDDDATDAKWVPLLDIIDGTVKLGFDHREILTLALVATKLIQQFR